MDRKEWPLVLWVALVALGLFVGRTIGRTTAREPQAAQASGPGQVVPGQFIAKIYTEALGRLPNQQEWQTMVDRFRAAPDCAQLVKDVVREIYTGSEFTGRNYDLSAQLLALYRGALNREPVPATYWNYYDNWSSGWPALVDDFIFSTHLTDVNTLVDEICTIGQGPFFQEAPYFWSPDPVISITVTGPPEPHPWVFCGAWCDQSQAALQQLLYSATITATNPTHTVYLAQKAVVWITGTVVIPAGVTLTTWSNDLRPISPTHYAQLGRLVRISRFPQSIVRMETGSTLQSVWVDGRYSQFNTHVSYDANNVQIQDNGGWPPATTTRVVYNRFTDPLGFTALQVLGSANNWWCGDVYIADNLITGYANDHQPRPGTDDDPWADGISCECEHTIAERNQIVDATDVGIVLYRTDVTTTQYMTVQNNVLLNAGNSAYGGLGINHLRRDYVTQTIQTYDFRGTVLQYNLLWTGPTAHMDIGLAVGSRAWHGVLSHYGENATFRFNTTGSQTLRTNSPIAVSGMYNASVVSNTLSSTLVKTCLCPAPPDPQRTVIVASWCCPEPVPPYTCTCAYASFAAPTPLFEDASINSCIQHSPAHWVFLPLLLKEIEQGVLARPAELTNYPPPGPVPDPRDLLPTPPRGYPLPTITPRPSRTLTPTPAGP